MEPWSGETKYRAILAISEAANEHLDLSALLDSVATALEDLVPVDIVGIVAREGDRANVGGHFRSIPRRSGSPRRGSRTAFSATRRCVGW